MSVRSCQGPHPYLLHKHNARAVPPAPPLLSFPGGHGGGFPSFGVPLGRVQHGGPRQAAAGKIQGAQQNRLFFMIQGK